MKDKSKWYRRTPATLVGLGAALLAGSILQVHAQFPINDSYVNNFDVGANTEPFAGSGSVASWLYWYNTPGNNIPMTNDVTMPDPYGGTGAGSLLVWSPFSAENGYGSTNHTQNLFFGTFGNQWGYDFSVQANLINFDYVSFDIYVGTNQVSQPDGSGGWGTLGVGIITTGYSYQEFANGRVEIPGTASNNWVHMQVPIDHTLSGITTAPGIAFNYNSYGGYPTNDFKFWIGNLVVHYNGAPPPPPTVALQKIVPGLTQFADKTPSYNRQDIRTDQSGSADLTWYGRTKPVTYSWKIAAFPSGTYSNYLSGFTLTPDPVASQNYSDPDWSATNCLWIAIQNNADGTATAGIAWKTNQPAANGQLFGEHQLVPYNNITNGLTVPTAVGTWTATFTSDTDLKLTAPNGASTNVVLDSDFAAMFNGYVGAYLYSSPTRDGNIGQSATYSAYDITGVGTPVHEDLTSGALSSPFLVLNSQNYFYTGNYTNNPPNQVFATADDVYWFGWTLPAAGYTPISTPTLNPTAWADIIGTPFQNGSMDYIKVSKSQLPGVSSGFYGMIQRTFTQLQVLLPGQTNAPGTALGYVGTPIPISLNSQGLNTTTITVNACDDSWHIISGITDQIHITTTDSGAYMPSGDLNMVNGTATFSGDNGILFQSQGAWTVSAQDMSSLTVTNIATSAEVTVGP
jgi:hypothetical protein